MKEDIKKIEQYIDELIEGPEKSYLDVETIAAEIKTLAVKIAAMGEYIIEMNEALKKVSEGNLDISIKRNNPYSGPLKQHIANLKHLTWQTKRIAAENYNHRVDFLGEFSDAFNTMIEQLEYRRTLIKENEKMQEAMYEQRQESLKREMEKQLSYFEKLKDSQEELRSFRHDINNHCITLESLLEDEKYNEAKEYIGTVSEKFLKPVKIVSSGNDILDAMLSEKSQIAVKYDIKYNVEMNIYSKLKMSPIDICILFGNAIDNAIEACCASIEIEKVINIKIVKRGEMLNVVIQNTAKNKPKEKNGNGFYETSKENSTIHGIGMKNMQMVVEKYDGFMKSNWANKEFVLTFLLNNV